MHNDYVFRVSFIAEGEVLVSSPDRNWAEHVTDKDLRKMALLDGDYGIDNIEITSVEYVGVE